MPGGSARAEEEVAVRWIAAALTGWLLAGSAGHAYARVERFAIVVGNNLGAPSEAPLRLGFMLMRASVAGPVGHASTPAV